MRERSSANRPRTRRRPPDFAPLSKTSDFASSFGLRETTSDKLFSKAEFCPRAGLLQRLEGSRFGSHPRDPALFLSARV
jgi:hypothetical protein